jgi:membrane fusion protein, copper/silver efflux system
MKRNCTDKPTQSDIFPKGRYKIYMANCVSLSWRGQGEDLLKGTSPAISTVYSELSERQEEKSSKQPTESGISHSTAFRFEMTEGFALLSRLLLLMAIVLLSDSCKPKPKASHPDIGKVTIDSTLKALIEPANQQVVGKTALVKPSYESKILTAEVQGMVTYDTRGETSVASRVAGRLEKLYIKYNYQPVQKGQLLFEIYAPDLAVAQQELIYLSQSDGDEHLLAQAKQRLLLLGMSGQTIQQVLRTKKVNYRIPVYSPVSGYILEKEVANNTANASVPGTESSGGDGMAGMGGTGTGSSSAQTTTSAVQNTAVLLREGQYVNAGQSLFTIYKADDLLAEFALKPDLAALVKKGSKLAFFKTTDKQRTFTTASVGLIQPLVKAGENFTVARVYLAKGGFKAGEILTAKIPVLVAQSYWLPETAVVTVGAQSLAFKNENGVFVAKPLVIGLRMNGLVQVKADIGNWQLAKNAAYLVDSESFLKVK